MNRTSLVIGMGLLASLLGCGNQPQSQPPQMPNTNTFLIDYAHESGGTFHHGTFSLVGGKVGATWTIDEGGKKKSLKIPMTEEEFRTVWDGLIDVPDFKAGAVNDPNQRLDPKTYHVVGIIFSVEDQKGMRTYMIPAVGASAAFTDWLAKLGYTGQ